MDSNSNTSHVLIYLNGISTLAFLYLIQIHLMFLFISKSATDTHYTHPIQIHLMFLFIDIASLGVWQLSSNSNTSHVLIYRPVVVGVPETQRHSNTSHVLIYLGLAIDKYKALEFKYISCSYLSYYNTSWKEVFCNSNTSHVLIYPGEKCTGEQHQHYSNTSHVLIYLYFPKPSDFQL